ncbi:MAG: nucleotidyltransferase domain-containing protein [bacterium]
MKKTREINLTDRDQGIVAKIKKAICEILPDAEIILFGSRARGNPEDDSDWDILVLTEQVTDEVRDMLYDIIYDIDLAENVVITPLILPKDEWEFKRYKDHPLHRNVDAEGVVL